MRIRQIKPDFWKHIGLADLKRDVRLLFIGLWCMADCEGRLDDDARLIKAEVFPMDEDITSADIDQWIEQLCTHQEKFLTRYVLGTKRYIQINNFRLHQHLMGNERGKKSKRPAPSEGSETAVKTDVPAECKIVRTESLPSTTDIRNNGYTEKKISCPKPKFSDEDMQTAKFIFDGIRRLNANAKDPNFNSWAESVRKMREIDKRTDESIRRLFTWANNDPFWQSNILSPEKLREKFDKLVVRQQNNGNGRPKLPQGTALSGRDIVPGHMREARSGKLGERSKT